jgi:plasmid stability protein
MSSDNQPTTGANLRVLSLRLDDQTKAQLEVLAQIQQRSLTDECRLGLEAWINASRADPVVLARAAQVREDIERDAKTRREAIAMVLGDQPDPPERRAGKSA